MKGLFIVPLTVDQKKKFTIGCITGFVYSACLAGIPFMAGRLLKIPKEMLQNNYATIISGIIVYPFVIMAIYLLHKWMVNAFVLELKLKIEKEYINYEMDYEGGESSIVINTLNEDIKCICENHYKSLFDMINSFMFVLAGCIYIFFASTTLFAIVLFFVALASGFQIISGKQIRVIYDNFRSLRLLSVKKATSFLLAVNTIINYQAEDYAFNECDALLMKKASMEKTFRFRKVCNSIILSKIPMLTLIACCLLACLGIINTGLQASDVIATIYISEYIIWEVIKLLNKKNSYEGYKNIEEEIKKIIKKNKIGTNKVYYNNDIILDSVGTTEKPYILRNLNLTFEKAKKYLICGESGSGKTTLLKIITGQLAYDGTINGHEYFYINRVEGVNYTPQKTEIIPEDIYHNITLCAEKKEDIINGIIEDLNISIGERKIDKEKISGGEIKKIEFSRGILHEDYPIWVFDEPFEGVDIESKRKMIQRIKKYKGMVLLTSHVIWSDLVKLFDEVIVLEKGILVFKGKLDDMPNNLKRYYIGV